MCQYQPESRLFNHTETEVVAVNPPDQNGLEDI